ncbi:magnesium chelatase domain-containing protein, partial [Mycolicibacterium obuense]|uniref:magnesium chelatase domain-containing protein n=1 Tax=Mycolicibacterium obuense TaxID=1807 RepID=UPI0023F964C5
MALGRAFSVAVRGVEGHIVEIEADISNGLPGVHLVGLADAALQESRDRVRAAINFPVKSACRTQLWFYIRPC